MEFRRVDNPGGGWPGTFLDVANAIEWSSSATPREGIWRPGWQRCQRLPEKRPLFIKNPLPVRGAINLGGISDLKSYLQESAGCGKPIPKLVGGAPEEVPERYRETSPIEMLPLGVKQTLIAGAHDTIVRPEHSQAYASAA